MSPRGTTFAAADTFCDVVRTKGVGSSHQPTRAVPTTILPVGGRASDRPTDDGLSARRKTMMNQPHDDEMTELRQLIDSSWADFIDAMFEAVTARVPRYRDLPREDVRRNLEETAGLFVRAVFGVAPSDDDLQAARALAGRRAADGLDIDDLVGALDAAADAGLRFVMELGRGLDQTGHPASDPVTALTAVATALLRTHSAVQAELVRGYSDAAADKVVDEALRAAVLVDRLLQPGADWSRVSDQLATAGLDGHGPWAVFVVFGQHDRPEALAAAAVDAAAELGGAVLVGQTRLQPVPHAPVVVAVAEPAGWGRAVRQAAAVIRRSGVLAVASGVVRVNELAAEHARHVANLEFASVFPPQSGLLDAAALQLCRALADGSDVHRALFFNMLLGPLVEHRDAHALFEVLDAMAVTDTLEAAADLVGFDVQTVKRRGRTIRKLTGRSWQNRLDRYLLTEAITFRRLAGRRGDYSARVWGPHPYGAQ